MAEESQQGLSRRERQIMDILYQRRRATAAEVREALPDAPSNSAVRGLLRILEEKGHLKHEREGLRYVYVPTIPRERAERSALQRLVETFFDGSVERVIVALLESDDTSLSDAELDRLAKRIEEARSDRLSQLIEQAQKEGR
jgi:predicted transcriptional regulator